ALTPDTWICCLPTWLCQALVAANSPCGPLLSGQTLKFSTCPATRHRQFSITENWMQTRSSSRSRSHRPPWRQKFGKSLTTLLRQCLPTLLALSPAHLLTVHSIIRRKSHIHQ